MLPVLVADIVNVPPLEIDIVLDARTPAVNAGVVPLPEVRDPVDEISAVPVNAFNPELQGF